MTAPVPRVTLTRTEAAASLGISLDSFESHVQRELRLIRRGSLVLVAVTELAARAETAGARTLPSSRNDEGRPGRRPNVPSKPSARQRQEVASP